MLKNKRFLSILCALIMCFGMMIPSAFADDAATGDLAYAPSGMVSDGNGGLYMVDCENNVLLHMDSNGATTVAAGTVSDDDDPIVGIMDYDPENPGKAQSLADVMMDAPFGIARYSKGYLITDEGNARLRYFDGKQFVTFKYSGTYTFKRPTGITTGPSGSVFVADAGKHCIVKIDAKGKATVYAGKSGTKGCADGSKTSVARFKNPYGIYYKNSKLYVADAGNNRVVEINASTKKAKTIAGSKKGTAGDVNGSATTTARLNGPHNVYVSGTTVYIADFGNGDVKKLKSGKVSTFISAYSKKNGMAPAGPTGLIVKDGKLWVGDTFAKTIIKKSI